MHIPNSPLFAPSQLSNHHDHLPASNSSIDNQNNIIFTPNLPDKPTVSTTSLAVYIIPSEQNLFVQGFEPHEYMTRPPTLLRGSLVIKVLKPTKIKSISLTFKGVQRTDWPEGIPPKKNQYNEINEIVTHTWPFFQGNLHEKLNNNGADCFIEKDGTPHTNTTNADDELTPARSSTPPPPPAPSLTLSPTRTSHREESSNFFTRNLSPSFIRRSKSPSISSIAELGKNSSSVDLSSSNSTNTTNSHEAQAQFVPGDYVYNFEHPLPASIPESCNVTFGNTSYYLEVSITRPGTFKSNIAGRLPLNIIRTLSESSLEENESIVITRDWEDQLRYDIVIGAKSVVLDSYLPLAFRFVPLYGKVALHRIRIYLTENLEYYCSNKKVHRMEPPKKYLLLEHKAKKGRSLLSSKNPEDQSSEENLNDFDDDILPKELEFQLFVPRELNVRTNSRIHPDTSYDNIQAHHWIKICLRISRQDPNNPEKRKHYEISIDSPLHVLHHSCTHNNTLLPAYDDLMGGSTILSQQNRTDPTPLSPGVTAVEHSRSRNGSVTNNVDFHHVSAGVDACGAVEREADMHLEANLYQPKDEANISAINSPQAMPHPDTFNSPLASPVQRPIHLLRKPSVNPPPFDPDAPPPMSIVPPPAYEEEESEESRNARPNNFAGNERSLSLSPLRIDDPISTATSTSHQPTNSLSPGVGAGTFGHVNGVSDMLIQQFRNAVTTAPPNIDEITSEGDTTTNNGDTTIPQIQISQDGENNNANTNTNSNSAIIDDDEDEEEEDIADFPSSPILPPSANNQKTSRSSSIASDFRETVPLLRLESHGSVINGGRNESVSSLMYEIAKPTEFVDGLDLSGDYYTLSR
ncbi:ALY2 Arrestin-related trafficking adapter 3 [Candida maltosa Xu316]